MKLYAFSGAQRANAGEARAANDLIDEALYARVQVKHSSPLELPADLSLDFEGSELELDFASEEDLDREFEIDKSDKRILQREVERIRSDILAKAVPGDPCS